ncbi:MAG: PF20097 family protein [Planctomycetota bacterium]
MAESIHESLKCPKCHGYMEEGALAVSQGLRWRRMKGMAMADMAEHLPNTHSVARPNHLVAYRCRRCGLVVADYGRPLEQRSAYDEHTAAIEADAVKTDKDG